MVLRIAPVLARPGKAPGEGKDRPGEAPPRPVPEPGAHPSWKVLGSPPGPSGGLVFNEFPSTDLLLLQLLLLLLLLIITIVTIFYFILF